MLEVMYYADAALATVVTKMLVMGLECVRFTWDNVGGHNPPYIFLFQNSTRAYFFESSGKSGTHFCVPMGATGIYILFLFLFIAHCTLAYSHTDIYIYILMITNIFM